MKVIGLAGEAGCGKSTVAKTLAERKGIVWLDLDRLAWESYRRGSPTYERLTSRFGKSILSTSGEIDRSKLAGIVFSDKESLADLNAIVHPALSEKLRSVIEEAKAKGTRVLLVEGALLGVSPQVDYSLFTAILWFTASRETREQRLRTADRVHHLRRHLMSPKAAHTINIDAEGTIEQTVQHVLEAIGDLPLDRSG